MSLNVGPSEGGLGGDARTGLQGGDDFRWDRPL